MASVLIVEDDHDIASLIKVNLLDLSLDVKTAYNGNDAISLATEQAFDLVILDLMLPDISGLDVCRQLRTSHPEIVIIMLTSRSSETDRVVGLELGADDYMTKPFSVRELQARIRTQLRRVALYSQAKVATTENGSQHSPEHDGQQHNHYQHDSDEKTSALCSGALVIDQRSHQVTLGAMDIELTATEFELLVFLAGHPNQVFSREELLSSVWGYHHSGYEHTVNSHINRLRKKLEQNPAQPDIVQTVWGVGYKFNPDGCRL